MSTQKPTLGRIVLFKLPDSHQRAGELRPAIVVNANGESDTVNLRVFLDPANDAPLLEGDACSVHEGTENRTWCWPPRS